MRAHPQAARSASACPLPRPCLSSPALTPPCPSRARAAPPAPVPLPRRRRDVGLPDAGQLAPVKPADGAVAQPARECRARGDHHGGVAGEASAARPLGRPFVGRAHLDRIRPQTPTPRNGHSSSRRHRPPAARLPASPPPRPRLPGPTLRSPPSSSPRPPILVSHRFSPPRNPRTTLIALSPSHHRCDSMGICNPPAPCPRESRWRPSESAAESAAQTKVDSPASSPGCLDPRPLPSARPLTPPQQHRQQHISVDSRPQSLCPCPRPPPGDASRWPKSRKTS